MRVNDHMVSQDDFEIIQCASCNFKRTSPRPDQKHIGRYYDSPAYKSHNETSKGLFDVLYNFLRDRAARKKAKFLSQRGPSESKIRNLLDVGCGIGVFLEAAKNDKWGVFGVEISENARKQAENRINQPVFEKLEQLPAEQKFDGITLFHVLEHLPEPLETMKALYAKATPGACLLLALPNPDSWDAHHYGTHWAAWDVPIHFWHFTKVDVKRLAQESEWSYESVHRMPLDAFYVGLLSESFRHGSKRWVSATIKGLWSNFKGGKDNSSSLMYVLRKPS
ncbi:MAG: class I SAM-dependent methyltransferase [Schleiferiaceae bacterium]|nr:class I SAM-dependent methyltransferase [Schleiferiaceae bacterium]